MATKINKNEMDAMVRNGAIETLNLDSVGTKIGVSTYAVPVETPEGVFYAKVAVTAAQRTATKSFPAFDLDTAVNKFNAEMADKEERAAEKEAKKAERAAQREAAKKAKIENGAEVED